MTDSLVTTEKRPLPNIVKIFMAQLGLSIVSCILFSMYYLFLLFTSTKYYYRTATPIIIIGLLFMLFILVWSISVFHGLYSRSPHAIKNTLSYLQTTFWLLVGSIIIITLIFINSIDSSRFYMPREGIQILLNIIYSIIFQLTILWAFVLYFNNSIAVKTAFNLQKPDTSAPQAGLPTSVGLLKLFSVIFILTTSAFLAVNLIDNYINRSFGDILKQTAAYLTMFILAATNLGFIILLKELKSKSSRYAIFFWLFVLLISTFLFYLPAAIAHNIYSLLSNLPLISNLYGLMIIALWWYFANDPEAKTWFNTDYDLQSNQWNIRIVRKVIEKMHSGVLPGFVLIFFIWYSQYLLFTMRFFFYLIIRGEILDPQPETLFYSYLFILNTVLSVLVWIISIFAAWKQKKYTPLLCMVLLILLAATRITPNLSLSTFDQYDIENLLTITAWFIYFLSSKKVKHVFYQREIPTDLINKNKAELPILCFRIFCLYTFAWSFVSCIIQYIFDGHFIIISAITVLVWSILPLINLYLSYKAKNVKTVYIWIFIWIVSLTLSITQIAPSGSYLYLYSQIKDLNYNGLFPAIVAFCYFYSSKKAKEYYLKLNK